MCRFVFVLILFAFPAFSGGQPLDDIEFRKQAFVDATSGTELVSQNGYTLVSRATVSFQGCILKAEATVWLSHTGGHWSPVVATFNLVDLGQIKLDEVDGPSFGIVLPTSLGGTISSETIHGDPEFISEIFGEEMLKKTEVSGSILIYIFHSVEKKNIEFAVESLKRIAADCQK